MPKTTSPAALDRRLNEIVSSAARAIADAVKHAIAAEAKRAPAVAPAAKPSPAKKSAAAPSSPTNGRKPHPRRSYTDADIDAVVALISSQPGLRSEQIKSAIGGDDRAVEKILAVLRESGRVQTTGIKRAMTYSIAGAAKPAARTEPKAAKKATAKGRKKRASAPAAPPAPAAAPEAPAAAPKAARARKKGSDLVEQVLAIIRAESGLRAEQITERVGQPAVKVKAALAKLREAKQVTTSGVARGTMYAAV